MWFVLTENFVGQKEWYLASSFMNTEQNIVNVTILSGDDGNLIPAAMLVDTVLLNSQLRLARFVFYNYSPTILDLCYLPVCLKCP